MNLGFQSAGSRPRRGSVYPILRFAACLALVLAMAALPASARVDQSAPAQVIAHIRGSDVSIDGQMLERASTLVSVVNGNVVTVHSGQASMRLVDGGEISICGPARITFLQSNGLITLALEFGSVHADLPRSVSIRVLTPSIVATPIDISGKRDLTVGLDQSDSLCVLASAGAVQLEQQFSGERLIVPESGDFALHGGQLIPSADDGRNCKCAALPQVVPAEPSPQRYPSPETAIQIPQQNAPAVIAPSAAAAAEAQQQSAADPPPVEVALLSRTNGDHPVAPKDAQPNLQPPFVIPPDAPPVDKIVLPPMVFSAASPSPPDIPAEETALLIRQVRADPDWEYDGSVASPAFAKELSKALGEAGPPSQSAPVATAEKKPKSFWASLKHFLVG